MAALAGVLAAAPVPRFSEHILEALGNDRVTGYVLSGRTLVTWGDRLLWRRLPQGSYRVVRGRGRAFSEGGCLLDVDGDGQADVVVNESGPEAALVWFRAPRPGGGRRQRRDRLASVDRRRRRNAASGTPRREA